MKRALYRSIFLFLCAVPLHTLQAQKDRFAFAVTGPQRQSSDWSLIRKFDFETGTYTDFRFDGHSSKVQPLDAATRKAYAPAGTAAPQPADLQPFATGVAALAYDKAHQRLYFTPMFVGQLRYLDLRTNKVFYVGSKALASHNLRQADGGKVITRMVIAPDGYGYTITNDGEHMSRFATTGRKPRIEELGALIDDPANKGYSIHASCTGYGGDMIADDAGNLYIITARNHVFRVTPANRVATYLATIKGLPERFTVNGAVIDEEGQLIVSSGVDESDYYRVDPQGWSATALNGNNIFRSSDLANSNYLQTKPNRPDALLAAARPPAHTGSRIIQVYPNPATGSTLTLQFHKAPAGDYTIELLDVVGRQLLSQRASIAFQGQTQTLSLPGGSGRGVYLVRVLDRNKKKAHEEKVIVQ